MDPRRVRQDWVGNSPPVLNRDEDFLVNRTDLELETIREVVKILKDELS